MCIKTCMRGNHNTKQAYGWMRMRRIKSFAKTYTHENEEKSHIVNHSIHISSNISKLLYARCSSISHAHHLKLINTTFNQLNTTINIEHPRIERRSLRRISLLQTRKVSNALKSIYQKVEGWYRLCKSARQNGRGENT